MKATKSIIGRLTVGCIFALGLVINVSAQDSKGEKPPLPGTYYSAKDFGWKPPLPFNPHPELPVVEIEPGRFLVDDTGVPDTPEQAEARKRWQEADALARLIAADPVLAAAARQQAEQAAKLAQEALDRRIQQEFVPWLHTDQRLADGNVTDEASRSELAKASLLALSEVFAQKAAQDKRAVREFLA